MKKKVAVVSVAETEEAARVGGLPLEARVALAEVAGAIKDGLLAFASATGLVVMHQMMQAELTERVGEKHAKIPAPDRVGNWHGTTKGSVVLGGRTVSTQRPRGRLASGTEIELDTWKVFSAQDLLNSLVVELMLAGVATRRHGDVAEPVGTEIEQRARSTSKSAISRRFVALVITADGTKVPVGALAGRHREQDGGDRPPGRLVARDLDTDSGVLCVIDGAKALAAGIKKVFGETAKVQRCTLHKRRNLDGYLPKELAGVIDRRLALIFAQPDADKGLAAAKRLAK